MNGLGFLIWMIKSMPPVAEVIHTLKAVNARWVSIKIANGSYTFNVDGGNDKPLIEFIEALKNAGFEVGGWHYIYPDNPGPQGDRAEERRQKLGLAHLLVDAESEWNEPYGMPAAAKLYLSKLKINNFPVGLCSYRYPEYFPNFPFPAFCNHETSDLVAPQVYWEGSHNPVAQLIRSRDEYAAITTRPFIPIGSTYGHTQKDDSWWEPSFADLASFTQWCKANTTAYGFYSLDWIFSRKKFDWLEAINGGPITEPPPPPPPPPPATGITFEVTADSLRIRSGPGTNYPIIGGLVKGATVEVLNVGGTNSWIEIEPGKWACVQFANVRHMKPVTGG